ncbi:unnamed protein product, partial [Mesorhabditis belari]|uniref:Uncharacterized protein n=1 Tax=Mesorhabditis belari TaxID=2138241 RepID=A0AAF3FJI3_9BILA
MSFEKGQSGEKSTPDPSTTSSFDGGVKKVSGIDADSETCAPPLHLAVNDVRMQKECYCLVVSNLRTVNMQLSRNVAVLGLSLLSGLALLIILRSMQQSIKSSDHNVSIRMLIGGLIAFILDNTVPGGV